MNEESIFAIALQRPSLAERQAYLDEACAGNAGLRAQVEELLRASDDAGSFLNHAPVSSGGTDATIAATRQGGDTERSATWTGTLPFLEPCDKPERIGKLGQYEIIEVVGYGGMGAVLRAFDTKLSRVVAVKVMAPELAANPMAVKRFLREAKNAAAVHHDHVVTIHAVDEDHRPPYLVMQFIDGQTLAQKIEREGALDLGDILHIGSQIAAGLAAAHKQGLIHRDVKPANILLENGVERVKITDFGLARAGDDLEMTQTGMIAGTPQYMSPEQAKGETIDMRSDLFSLGSVLYTMCTGRAAFRAETTMGVLHRVCSDVPRPIHEVNPEIPIWLDAIVNKLLAKNPADRFQTAGEVAELLGQHLAHVQSPTLVPRPATVVVPPPPPAKQAAPGTISESVLDKAVGVFLMVGRLSIVAGVVTLFFLEDIRQLPFPLAFWLSVGGVASIATGLWIQTSTSKARSQQSHAWAMTAGIVSVLPLNPFAILWLPLTLWSLIWLRRKSAPIGPAPWPWRVAFAAALIGTFLSALVLPFFVVPRFFEASRNTVTQGTLRLESGGGITQGRIAIQRDGRLVEVLEFPRQREIQLDPGMYQLEVTVTDVPPLSGLAAATFPSSVNVLPGQQSPVHIRWVRGDLGQSASPDAAAGLFSSVPAGGNWTQLFNGQDLTGWKTHRDQPGNWRVENGVLIGSGSRSHLFTERGDFRDFHLRAEAMINNPGDSGLYFRSEYGLGFSGINPKGYEAQIGDASDGHRTGSLYDFAQAPEGLVSPDKWFTLEVIARGNHLQVLVDGKSAVDYTDAKETYRAGHIALQTEGRGTIVQFRNVEIKELTSASDDGFVPLFNGKDLAGSPAGTAPPLAIAPFDADQAKAHQEAWARHLGIGVEIENSLGMKLRLIPPGEFQMGTSPEDLRAVKSSLNHEWEKELVASEAPPRRVTIDAPFYLAECEVTVAAFRSFVTAKQYRTSAETNGKGGRRHAGGGKIEDRPEWKWDHPELALSGEHPVVEVSFKDAQAFCAWLSEKEGRKYVVPSEEQWEFACRAGTTTRWFSGDEEGALAPYAWTQANAVDLQPVGRKAPNPFGLKEMHGNAEEYATILGGGCAVRGGSVGTSPPLNRSACRFPVAEDNVWATRGFRVAIVGDLRPKSTAGQLPDRPVSQASNTTDAP